MTYWRKSYLYMPHPSTHHIVPTSTQVGIEINTTLIPIICMYIVYIYLNYTCLCCDSPSTVNSVVFENLIPKWSRMLWYHHNACLWSLPKPWSSAWASLWLSQPWASPPWQAFFWSRQPASSWRCGSGAMRRFHPTPTQGVTFSWDSWHGINMKLVLNGVKHLNLLRHIFSLCPGTKR